MKRLVVLLTLLFAYKGLVAQADSLSVRNITPVMVTAPKINTGIHKMPLSISKYSAGVFQISRQQLSLQEYVNNIPGLFTMNANNFAQDLRISIRGFGARAAFGIRGIKIIVDGIPETTADGQGQLDNLNLNILQSMEVIRGPASSLYGNASGGVIQIKTTSKVERNYLEAGLQAGAFNMQQYYLTGGLQFDSTTVIIHGSRSTSDGYRDNSAFENNNLNLRLFHNFSQNAKVNFLFNYADSPTANDPGGINLDAVNENRQQARDRNVLFRAGESINQWKAGANFSYDYDEQSGFDVYAFYAARNFYGRLPFENGGIVDLGREYFGTGGSYHLNLPFKKGIHKIQVGYDIAAQADNRLRYNNIEGIQGDLSFDQLESFSMGGAYLLNQLNINQWLLSAGIRYDYNILNAQDHFPENGDDSGERFIRVWNPSIGLSYQLSEQHAVYANFSTSYETPSLSELSANPSGEEGFNRLNPQEAKNYEIGFKGNLGKKGQYDFALFHIDTENDLVPFELDSFPGRTFYRNSGTGTRNGLEVSLQYFLNNHWSINANYTFSDFTYGVYELDETSNFNGNQLPAIPKHFATASLQYKNKNGLHAAVQARYIGELFANDENSVSDDAYLLINIRAGYTIQKPRFNCTPFLGVQNILDTEYNDNIRINAFGSRYYEPGPGLAIYGGLRFRLFPTLKE